MRWNGGRPPIAWCAPEETGRIGVRSEAWFQRFDTIDTGHTNGGRSFRRRRRGRWKVIRAPCACRRRQASNVRPARLPPLLIRRCGSVGYRNSAPNAADRKRLRPSIGSMGSTLMPVCGIPIDPPPAISETAIRLQSCMSRQDAKASAVVAASRIDRTRRRCSGACPTQHNQGAPARRAAT